MEFNLHELFEMARRIEHNGVRFYHHLANISVDPGRQQTFAELAAMEHQHEQTFVEMQDNLAKAAKRQQTLHRSDSQQAQYLWAWVDKHVFDTSADPVAKLQGNETTKELLQVAIGLEKDSIVFYQGLRESLPGKDAQAGVGAIIAEEMQHIARLAGMISGLEVGS